MDHTTTLFYLNTWLMEPNSGTMVFRLLLEDLFIKLLNFTTTMEVPQAIILSHHAVTKEVAQLICYWYRK
jgi:hypothetical protein